MWQGNRQGIAHEIAVAFRFAMAGTCRIRYFGGRALVSPTCVLPPRESPDQPEEDNRNGTMLVRIYFRAFEQQRICVPVFGRQRSCILPCGESPKGVACQGDPQRLGFSQSGKDRGTHGGADAPPQPHRPPVHDGGNVTARALLIGGCIFAVGVFALVAIRFSQVPSGDAESPATPTAETPVSDIPMADTEIEDDANDVFEIPDIAIPDNPDALQVANRRQKKRVSIADATSTDVASSEQKKNEEAPGRTENSPRTMVPDVFRIDGPIAIPKYDRPDPYAEVQTVDLIDDARGHRVMASLKEICVHVVPLQDDVRGDVSAAVSSGVRGALERCQLRFRGGISEPIMLVQLNVAENGDVPLLSMTATLLVNRESRMLRCGRKRQRSGLSPSRHCGRAFFRRI